VTELLLVDGRVQRRYDVKSEDHTPEILALWRPLVARLYDRPAERLYHGLPGLPYWEASMRLPSPLDHPALAPLTWLCLYASPSATHPYYVGYVARSRDGVDGILGGVSMVYALGGYASADPVPVMTGMALPALVGGYMTGPMLAAPDPQAAVRSAGECAAILARLILEAFGETP
jgi:hypothetical protein